MKRIILNFLQSQRFYIIMNIIDFIYPPNVDKAYHHRLASRIFKGTDQQQNTQVCACCDRNVGTQEVDTPCNIQPNQLSFLGPGAPLFFHFLKYIIFLLAIMVVIFVGFSIFTNAISSDCSSSNGCIGDAFTLLSIINKLSNTTYLSIQSYVSLGFVIVTILYFHFFRYQARKLQQECDELTNSPSDYAIILRRLPQNIVQSDVQQAIQTFKNQLINQGNQEARKIKVVKIIYSYSLRQYNEVKQRNQEQFHQSVKQDRLQHFKPEQLPKPSDLSKIAIVVFDLQSTKELFIHKPSIGQAVLRFFCTACTPRSNLAVKGQRVGVQRAPQPDQISWQNSGITMAGSIWRVVLYTIIAIIILLLGGLTQYGLQVIAISTQDQTKKFLLDISSSLIVTVFNALILITLQITTKKERAQTLTQFQTSLMVKITLSQFFNAGIFVIIAQIAANLETFTLQTSNIVSQISLIMILDAIIPNTILFCLNYFQILQRIKRFLVSKNFIIASQKQLNKLYMSPAIDLPNKYAYVLKTLWLTGLYAPMIPIVVLIALLGLTLNYFLQKFLFTKCYSIPNTLSTMAFESGVELMQYFIVTFAIGQFIIYAYFYNYKFDNIPLEWTVTISITVALSLLNCALPMKAINQKLFIVEDSKKSELTYGQVKQSFEVTYEMSNPAYKTTRKRKDNKNTYGYQSVKSKRKLQQQELTNQMNKSVQNKNISNQPLLKEIGYTLSMEEVQSQKQQSSIMKSPKILINSKTLRQDSLLNQSNQNTNRLLTTQQVVSKERQQKNQNPKDGQKSIPAEQKQKSKDNPKQSKQQKQAKRPQQKRNKQLSLQKILKKQTQQFQQKALKKFKYVQITSTKNNKDWDYQIGTSKSLIKQNETFNHDNDTHKESALVFDPKNPNNIDHHLIIDQDFKNMLKDKSNSKSSLCIQESQQKKNPIFSDPVKQKKSTYDPIKLSKNYRNFFSDIQSMKQKEGKYLNNKYVMAFLGTPFSNLVKRQIQTQKPVKQEE